MTKVFCILISVIFMLSLFGCANSEENTIPEIVPSVSDNSAVEQDNQDVENSVNQSENDSTTVIVKQPMASVSVPTITEETTTDDGIVLFRYTYQNMTLVLQDPEVAEKVIIDFLTRIDNTRPQANTTSLAAASAYSGEENWIPYLYHVTYSPVRIDPDVLSLFGTDVLYNGAFHPERTCISANYNLMTGDVLTLASIMNHNASTDMFCQLVLAGLTELRDSNYLYSNYEATVKQRFSVDPSQDENWYFTQTGLCFYFSPYEIAPYSSGVISVEIPYENLTGIIRDEYFPPDRNNPEGSLLMIPFYDAELSSFTEIAEIIENKDGEMYLFFTEGNVEDIRIIISDAASSYTIFAAYGLSPGQAVVLQTKPESLPQMMLSYKSGSQTMTSILCP